MVGFHRMEKGELRGWKIPPAGQSPAVWKLQQGWIVDLFIRGFRRCYQLSPRSCPELLHPPEAFRSITLHSRHQGQIKEKGTMNSFVGYFLWKGDDREEF